MEKERKPFSVADFISNEETPVETESGFKVVIFTTERNDSDYPIAGDILRYVYNSQLTAWNKNGLNEFHNCVNNKDNLFFSIKKKIRRMTNRELSWWLQEHKEEPDFYKID